MKQIKFCALLLKGVLYSLCIGHYGEVIWQLRYTLVTVSVVDCRAVEIMLNVWTIPSAKESEHCRQVAVVAIGRWPLFLS